MGSRILVTGGAGFIGTHLCARLLDLGNHVICVDDLSNSWNHSELDKLRSRGMEFTHHDVQHPFDIPCDQIYHLACPASPVHYQRDPIRTIHTSFVGTNNCLTLAKKYGAQVLLASTSEIYGDPEVNPQDESYRGSVNTLGPRACYDDQTDVLTDSGWIRFADLKPDMKVATRTETGKVEFHIPEEHIIQDYVGEMIEFSNDRVDLCVTPNHKLYLRDKANRLLFKEAAEIVYGPSWRVPTGGSYTGEDIEYREFDQNLSRLRGDLRRVRMDDWLEFLGYYLSEGCAYIRPSRKRVVNGKEYDLTDYSVQIAQVKPAGRAKISSCLDRIGINYQDSDRHAFRISSKYLVELLRPLGKSHFKYIPREYMGLSIRQSRILLDALMVGDGTWSTPGQTGVYYTMSTQLADNVQELALRCGFAANISKSNRGLSHVNLRRPVDTKLPHPVKKTYSGKVYCVNVQNHVVLVRRNGKSSWCGNCYDEGKRAAETLAWCWNSQHNVDARIVRIFNTYGPMMSPVDGRLIPNFITQALRDAPITIYGDGTQTRSFCYVVDTVSALIRLMAAERTSNVPVYNIGNPEERTVLSVARMIIELTRSQSEVVHMPLPIDDPKIRCPDISKAARDLEWNPEIGIYEGLQHTIAWFAGKSC